MWTKLAKEKTFWGIKCLIFSHIYGQATEVDQARKNSE